MLRQPNPPTGGEGWLHADSSMIQSKTIDSRLIPNIHPAILFTHPVKSANHQKISYKPTKTTPPKRKFFTFICSQTRDKNTF